MGQKTYSTNYLLEKFTYAVYDLATGESDARSRVGEAYRRFWTIPLEDYPEGLKGRREKINKLLTRLGGGEGNIISHNLARMKNKTASKISILIIEIYFELNEIQKGRAR